MSFFTAIARRRIERAAEPDATEKEISDAIEQVNFLAESDSPLAVKLLGEHAEHPVENVRSAISAALEILSKSEDPAVREFAQAKLASVDAQKLQKMDCAPVQPKKTSTEKPNIPPSRKTVLLK